MAAFLDFQDRKELPIDRHKFEILEHIRNYQVTCIHGETGSGKSTRVPEFILEEHSQKLLYGDDHLDPLNIVITQPRRIGATSLAKRVAKEVGEPEVGGLVGYKIGQEQVCGALTQICYVTSGYLIELLVHHPEVFEKFTHLILDEVHERDMDADLLSLVVKILMKTENKPKLIVMSATLQADLFLKYFIGGADHRQLRNQVYDINVRSPFPVQVVYLEQFYNFLLKKEHKTLSEATRKLILITYCNFMQVKPMDLILREGGSESERLMAELAETLDDIPDVKLKSDQLMMAADQKVMTTDDYLPVAVDVIKAIAKAGDSILVFLPGLREIEELYDKLQEFEESPHHGWNCQLLLFALHSQVPFDDQQECFKDPEPHLCHVIMATNIAESSITLPKITAILDFGQRRYLTYDTRMRIEFLKLKWCSKASMNQRKGRTGRVCEGVCFRVMPEPFYEGLDDYDEAEMEKAPLDKTVLKVKQVAEKISPEETIRQLFEQTVTPPSVDKIDCALQNLAAIGAITSNDENAAVTLLGRLCACLPLDLHFCRLVLFGILFNQPCDGIVMAASLQGQDPFKKPMKRLMKDQKKFIELLRGSSDSRRKYDGRSFSEPIMYRNMVKDWLEHVDQTNKKSLQEEDDAVNTYKLRRKFCKQNYLDSKILATIEGLIFDVTRNLLKWLPKDSANRSKVEDLMKIVPRKKQVGGHFSTWAPNSAFLDQVEDLFCTDVLKLHMILAAAFVPRFMVGNVKTRKGYLDNQKLEAMMSMYELDPADSVIITDIPAEVQNASDAEVRHIIEDLSLQVDTVMGKYPNLEFDFIKEDSQLFVQFKGPREGNQVPESLRVTDDVHVGVHYMYQFSEAPSVKSNEFSYQMRGPGSRSQRKKYVKLKMPQNPYKTEWILLSYDGEPLQNKEFRIFCDWRNPVGFLFDASARPLTHYGVTADLRAGSGGGNPVLNLLDLLIGLRPTEKFQGGFGWAEGANFFPTYQKNRFALLLMLAFVPDLNQVVFTVNTKRMTIVKVQLYEMPIDVPPDYPLTKKILRTINKLRTDISQIFTWQDGEPLFDSRLEARFLRLMLELKEETSSNPSDPTTKWETDIPSTISVKASYRSQQPPEDTFVYLHPYDTNVLFKQKELLKYHTTKNRLALYSSDSDGLDEALGFHLFN